MTIEFLNALLGTLDTTQPGDGVIASDGEAQAGSSNKVLMTPHTVRVAGDVRYAQIGQGVPLSGDGPGYFLGKTGTGDFDFGWLPAGGTGTVQTITIDTANGFAGASDGDPDNPTLTLSTTVTGLLKGDGTEISAAVDGTDFQGPITLTTTGSSGAATFDGTTLNIPQYSGDVTASANIANDALVVGDGGGKGIKGHASGAPGTAAFKDIGTSGDAVPVLNAANTFSADQTITAAAPVLTVIGDGNAPTVRLSTYSSALTGGRFLMQTARNTAASPQQLLPGNFVFLYDLRAYNGTQFETAAQITATVASTNMTGSGDHPSGALRFRARGASDTGPFSSGQEMLVLNDDADLGVHFPTIGTTGNAANAFLDSSASPANKLLRSTSSLAYKTDVEALELGRAVDAIGRMEPIWYRSLAEADKLDDGAPKSFYSFGAEPMAEIDPRLVTWGYRDEDHEQVVVHKDEETGEEVTSVRVKPDAVKVPMGINDRAVIAMLVSVVQQLEARIAVLEASDEAK